MDKQLLYFFIPHLFMLLSMCRVLYQWYGNLVVCVKWNGKFSNMFEVTKGMRQSSILSSKIFNIFIDDLLRELYAMSDNIRIGDYSFNVFAYIDDVNVFRTSVPGLQINALIML